MEKQIIDRAFECRTKYYDKMNKARSDYQMLYYSIDEVVEILNYIVGK